MPSAHWVETYKDCALSERVLSNLREFAKELPKQGEPLEPEGRFGTEAFAKARFRNEWRKPDQAAGFIRKASGDYETWKTYCAMLNLYPRYGAKAGGRLAKDMEMLARLDYELTMGRLTYREAAAGAWLVVLKTSRYRPWMAKLGVWLPTERMEQLLR